MKGLKTIIVQTVAGLCLSILVSITAPAQGLAYTLEAHNPYNEKLDIALVDYDDDYGGWRCHGWWTVQPESSRTINIPSSTAQNHLYIYAKTANAAWGGEGYPASIRRTVISEKFSYHDDEPFPRGSNGRKVYFMKEEIFDGHLDWQP